MRGPPTTDTFLFLEGCSLVGSYFQIVIPQNHAAPYCDPITGKEAPFITMGPFSSMDMLFPGIAGDLELYTTEEVMHLRSAGVVKSSSGASLSLSKLSSLASLAQIQSAPTTPKIIPGSPNSSSKKRDYTSSLKSHKCLVTVAAGSSTSLERSNVRDCDAEHRWHEKDKGHDKNHERSRKVNKIVPIKRARAHTASVPQGMTIAGWPSMADLLNLVVPWGVPVQRNNDFTVEADHVIMSTDTLAHQNAYPFHHLQPFILLL